MSQDKLKILYHKMFAQSDQHKDVVEDIIPQPNQDKPVIEDIIPQPKATLKSTQYSSYRPTIEEFDKLFGEM